MQKRVLSMIMALVILLGIGLPVTAFAAGPAYALENQTVTVGEEFEVPVSISGNSGIISLRFKIFYDEEVLELVGIEDQKLLNGYTTPSPVIGSPYTLRWADALATSNNNAEGAVVKLKFKALQQTDGTEIKIQHGESRDHMGSKVTFADASAAICVEPVRSEFSFVGSNMTLGNALDMNFFVNQTDIEGEENYAVITKHYADGRDDKVVKIPQSQWEKLGSSMYYFTFSGVTAKEMGDVFETVIYNAEGEAISEVRSDSIQDYARRMLDKEETKDKDKSLYVEMLNYGAAAQVKFGYDTENLVSSVVTAEEQEKYAMSSRTYTDRRVKAEGYVGTSLTLESRILFNVVFDAKYITEDAYVVSTFENHNQEYVVSGIIDEFNTLGQYKYVSLTNMSVADRSQIIEVVLFDGKGNPIVTVTDSIESYVARMATADPLYEAIMKFADAAYQYFHSDEELENNSGKNEPSTEGEDSPGFGTPETEDYGFCPKCGRRIWTSWYPSGCFTYLVDTVCECGVLVHALECHYHE